MLRNIVSYVGASIVLTSLAGVAGANVVIHSAQSPQVRSTFAIGDNLAGTSQPNASVPGAAYSNLTNFVGSAVKLGGAVTGSLSTYAIADDLTLATTSEITVSEFSFSLANLNTSTRTIKPSIRFYLNDGVDDSSTPGAPGTLIAGFDFNAVSVAGSSVTVLTYDVPTADQFKLSPGTVEMSEFFLGGTGTTSTTAAQVNNWAMGLFDPPDVGSSTVSEWDSDLTALNAGGFLADDPAGFIYSAGYGTTTPPIPANYGFEIIPEPVSLSALAFGGLLLRRRRI